MSDRIQCVFSLIRYVPNVVRGEFVNIGVILEEANPDAHAIAADDSVVRFTRDWTRVQCISPRADLKLLKSLEKDFANRLQGERVESLLGSQTGKRFLDVVRESFSNSLQITDPQPCLAESVEAEMLRLMRMYISEDWQSTREKTNRRKKEIRSPTTR